ncbi:MAG TPA: signal peptidase II [Xanthobacteraceae bacterium]|jgi:signal peptidase II|nr:signal peptidase II [Xanthobacteraceae bacterium]
MAAAAFRGGAPWRLGLTAALAAAAVDQAVKLWLLHGFGLTERGRVPVTSFLDLVLAWNTGISYGLFQDAGPLWQWVLLGLKTVAVVLLLAWLARTRSRFAGIALGLIVGGAIGNAIDRAVHGAVMDFVLFHVTAGAWAFQWYVFNLADAAIVAGVIGLVYESLFLQDTPKLP